MLRISNGSREKILWYNVCTYLPSAPGYPKEHIALFEGSQACPIRPFKYYDEDGRGKRN